ncbi:hypothetical protein NE237_012897 [Protea cynaroides]|uniref:Transmembrane protein 230 n=1 Tax=Protea cynaroides TaxID=273540 RepID=A0A9Q0GYV0_9MAGN|nr:hypothetical protein NE237_012897 [Protea cynaroides]
MTSRRNVHYSLLSRQEERDYDGEREDDPRFAYTPKSLDQIPWKSIALALFLLSLGVMLLFLSFFIFTGHMGGDRSQAYGLLMLGILTFLPGFYETRVAYYSSRGAKGHFNIFVGNLSPEVIDATLFACFSVYPSCSVISGCDTVSL